MVQIIRDNYHSEYLKCLFDDGYVVIENYVSSNDLASLKSEFEIVIKKRNENYYKGNFDGIYNYIFQRIN